MDVMKNDHEIYLISCIIEAALNLRILETYNGPYTVCTTAQPHNDNVTDNNVGDCLFTVKQVSPLSTLDSHTVVE